MMAMTTKSSMRVNPLMAATLILMAARESHQASRCWTMVVSTHTPGFPSGRSHTFTLMTCAECVVRGRCKGQLCDGARNLSTPATCEPAAADGGRALIQRFKSSAPVLTTDFTDDGERDPGTYP